jgi:RNA polymerase sigma factor (sigma-70 family)
MGQKQQTQTPLPIPVIHRRCRAREVVPSGDVTAWRSLYDRYAPLVHRFASALGVPVDEREDAAQDIFIAVFRSLKHFRGEAQLSTWIYRIAARHAIRLGRRRRTRETMRLTMLNEKPTVLERPLRALDASRNARSHVGQAPTQKANRSWSCLKSKDSRPRRSRTSLVVRRTPFGRGCITPVPKW